MSVLIKDMEKHCSNCMYSGRPTYKSPCSECRDNSQWEMKPISRSHENGVECEDTVSRKDVIDLYKRGAEIIAKAKGISAEDLPHNGLDVLMNLSSVTPKQKTGKWLDDFNEGFKCSECGAYLEIDCGDAEMNFCPNCGCRML